MKMAGYVDRYCSFRNCTIVFLILTSFVLSKLSSGWVKAGKDYEAGNRKRIIAIMRMECVLTLCSMFIYSQLMDYYDQNENELSKHDRRIMLRDRGRASKALLVFIFLSQLVYLLYIAPHICQLLLFDVCAVCSGIWTNLLGIMAGFFLINCSIHIFEKIPAVRPFLEKLYNIRYIGEILSDRKYQIKVALVATAVMSVLMWYSSDKIVVKQVVIPVKNFSGADGGVRFALVSDVHSGASVYSSQVENVVDTLFTLDVDAVLLVGDLVDGSVEQIGSRLEPLWKLTHRFPTYFVSGNHEYYYGNAQEWFELYKSHRINVLNNQCEMFHRLCLIGLNDISSQYSGIKDHHMNLSVAMENCTSGSTRVVLAHNPASVLSFTKDDLEKIDVVLSGHTHAAQYYVLAPVISQILPYFHGLYDLPHGHGKLFVTAGTLYQGAPMKMLRMSEIWVVNLVSDQ